MAHKGENLSNALKDLTSLFHKISIAQIINDEKQFSPELMDLANQFTAQDLQLYYQIAINGQKDMSLSPSEQIGLEMTLLRMVTFHPNFEAGEKKTLNPNPSVSLKKNPSKNNSKATSTTSNKQSDISNMEVNHLDIKSQDGWEKIITQLDFNGAAKMLVKNTVFKSLIDQNLTLTLSEEFVNLHTTKTEESIRNALHKIYPALVVMIEPGETNGSSLSQKESVKNKQIQKQTENQFLSDDGLQELQEVFKSQVDLKSIKSIKESDNV